MTNFDANKTRFTQIDKNQDGSIDQNEFRNWNSNVDKINSSSFASSTNELVLNDNNTTNQIGINGYQASSQNAFESTAGINTSNTVARTSNELTGNVMVQANRVQQSNEFVSRSSSELYDDPNPQIVRRAALGGPVTYQQRIFVRFLQPPDLPTPGPLIIKEVRPPQPPPPPPLVVRQSAPPLPVPPPLILRERPPVAPAPIATQTIIRRLPAVPVPPRSVIIERLPQLPPKPRDIIIERWIPYGPQPKRRTVVQRAAAAVQYPKPRNIIVVYDAVQVRIIRQFQRSGVTQEDPQAYMARYGRSLLNPDALIQQARSAGVIEDISPPLISSSTQFNSSNSLFVGTEKTTGGFDASNTTTSQGFSSSNAIGFEGLHTYAPTGPGIYGLETVNNGNANYSSSSSNFVGDSALAGSVGIGSAGFDMIGSSFAAADTNRDGRLDQVEFQRFIQSGF